MTAKSKTTKTRAPNKCKVCGYKWIPRAMNRVVKCPNCQSHNWDGNQPPKKKV